MVTGQWWFHTQFSLHGCSTEHMSNSCAKTRRVQDCVDEKRQIMVTEIRDMSLFKWEHFEVCFFEFRFFPVCTEGKGVRY